MTPANQASTPQCVLKVARVPDVLVEMRNRLGAVVIAIRNHPKRINIEPLADWEISAYPSFEVAAKFVVSLMVVAILWTSELGRNPKKLFLELPARTAIKNKCVIWWYMVRSVKEVIF